MYEFSTFWSFSLLNTKFILLSLDGIAGEALFHTIHKCVGPEFNHEAAVGWTKVYSVFLKYLIPYVVRFELAHKDQSKAIADKRQGRETAPDLFTKHQSMSLSGV